MRGWSRNEYDRGDNSNLDNNNNHHSPNRHSNKQEHRIIMSNCEEITTVSPLEDDCLSDRKWWCFLLSSIFTFFAGLTIVLLWRAFAFLCCRKEPEFSPNDPKQKEQKAARQGKQEFEGTFMTEAKDWAGELISGQTTTGRILVSLINSDTCLAYSMCNQRGNFVGFHILITATLTVMARRCW